MLVQSLLRMEAACFFFTLFIAFMFIVVKREKTTLHKYFANSLISLIVHLVFDSITVYTVNNMDTVSPFINDTMHRIYLMTMLFTIYFMYKYVSRLIYEETEKQGLSKFSLFIQWLLNIYMLAAEILLAITPITYVETAKGNYESGIGKTIMFISVTCFMIHMILNIIIHFKNLQLRTKVLIILALFFEITTSIITAVENTLLLAGLGLTLMMFAIYLTLEQPNIQMVRQLSIEKKKADDANASKSKFLSIVSHEMRTPMNAVVGMTELMLNDNPSDKQKKYLLNIQSSGKALVALLNDILDLSKIEAGKLQIIEQPYKFEPILDDVRMIIENRIGSKPIKLVYDIDEKIPATLYGDGLRIRQIFINLLNNSVKFTKEGEIRLTVKMLSSDNNKMSLEFRVRDTGQGIKQEDLSKLFKAFSQVDQEKNHGKEGTGMGLSISSDLIALMGGHLEVASEYGEWTEFFFTIDQGFVNEECVSDKETVHQSIKGLKVLVVDDAEINLEIAKEIFEMFEVEADTAESGKKALKMVKPDLYDVIFTDYIMPEMNGTEFTEQIRNTTGKYFETVPIIALTGDVSEEARAEFEKAGVNDFIEKPIDPEKLCKITEKYAAKLKV